MTRVLLLLLILISNASWADPQSRSWSSWTNTGTTVEASYTVPLRDAALLAEATRKDEKGPVGEGSYVEALREALMTSLSVTNAHEACIRQQLKQQGSRPGYLSFRINWECPDPVTTLVIEIRVFEQAAPSHIHFARFSIPGETAVERIFSRRDARQSIGIANTDDSPALSSGQVWLAYTAFGFEHILIGADHIAFLLGLVLLTRRALDVILVVTGFTLGHSFTLALATLGLVTPQLQFVEALIGYTIALVALENVLSTRTQHRIAAHWMAALLTALAALALFSDKGPPPLSLAGVALFSLCYLQLAENPSQSRSLRPALTTLFGLVHGFGFASVLAEVGLPDQSIVSALLAFNIGVELGQIAIVLVLALLAWTLRHLSRQRALAEALLNSSLCGLGVFWFLQRLYA